MPRRNSNSQAKRPLARRNANALAAATLAMLAFPGNVLGQNPQSENSNYNGYAPTSAHQFPVAGDLSASPWSRPQSPPSNRAIELPPPKVAERTQQIPPPSLSRNQQPATLHWGTIQAVVPTQNGHAYQAGHGYPSVEGLGNPRPVSTRAVSNPTEIVLNPPSTTPTPPIHFGENDSSEYDFGGGYNQPEFTLAPPLTQPEPPQVDPRWIAEQERFVQRQERAQRLSDDILKGVKELPAAIPQPLERPAGWESVEQALRIHMENCQQLLRRGAIHSAREEVVTGLRRLARTLDGRSGQAKSEPAMEAAFTALREEADFHQPGNVASIRDVVSTHTTPALQGSRLEGVTSEVASQHYRQFARAQFVIASERHRWGADLLYAYGKTLEKEADNNFEAAIRLRSQAVICYQAALQIQQGHPEASTQLGYTLMRLDRPEEAQQILNVAVHNTPNATNWANLAEVYRRRGAMQQADYAIAQANQLGAGQNPAYSHEHPQVTQIAPSEFARYSPAQNLGAPVATTSQEVPTPPSTPRTANLFSNLFR